MRIACRGLIAAGLVLLLAGAGIAAERQTGTLTGKLAQKNGAPLSGGLVFFFNQVSGPPPSPEEYWRVPDEIADLDNDGRFSAELLEGTYFVGAIQRMGAKEVGPPIEGDLFLVGRDPQGKPRTFTVKAGQQQDLGTIAGALPFGKTTVRPGTTGIEGVVVGPEGKPVVGVFVFAFLTPAMVGRPLFVSEKTGPDGRFLLRLAEGGEYYLKAKELYGGGPPRQGGIIGAYGDDEPKAVKVKSGAIAKGISIKGLRFPGQGRKP
ncbi:MAG: carboxypeptidase regulatory-like domain-containing protein [Geobacter sp.]|nr:carboxypeptidase regulatory-like domain-containing protein [Geobacter sp.]